MPFLDLAGGWHAGPLFVYRVRRPPIYPKGKEGLFRHRQTRRAMPPWADPAAIRAVYKEAKRVTRETGILHVVDHIVPKIHPCVCGLHVVWNLRVITEAENIRKSNLYWPDMPMEQQSFNF